MLTTLVFATAAITVLASIVALATLNFDAENHWDPRTQLRAAAHLMKSCVVKSQMYPIETIPAWIHVSRVLALVRNARDASNEDPRPIEK